MSIQSTLYCFREFLFPSGCAGCGKALRAADARYGLCEKCRASFGLALVSGRRCRCCGKPLITERGACLPCRTGGTDSAGASAGDAYSRNIKRLRVLFPYTGKFKAVLGSYKFGGAVTLGLFFARCLSLSLEALGPGPLGKASWVPVPPRPGKIRRQGWDQVEFLARQLGKAWRHSSGNAPALPVSRCLRRLPSKSQKLLGREERLANLKGRFRCVKKPPETAVLFDDVITTGATLDACASALLEAGTKQVYAVCLFYRE